MTTAPPPPSPPPPTPSEPPDAWRNLDTRVSQVFRPATPIDEDRLFAGRKTQMRRVLDACNQPGQHAILFGERGVGKTSLTNVMVKRLAPADGGVLIAQRVNCDRSDDYSALWRKVFAEIRMATDEVKPGLVVKSGERFFTLDTLLPDTVTPNDVRRLLSLASQGAAVVIALDELDRLPRQTKGMLADTIKMLSDHSISASLVLVGVADTVDELLEEHRSVERNLVQVPVPRMSPDEIREIVLLGFDQLAFTIAGEALARIALLSQGLPHYTHLLALHATRAAIDEQRRQITLAHVESAIRRALDDAHQSTRSSYRKATFSNRKDTLYPQVLLACALAKVDEHGYFAPAAVRAPFQRITGKDYDIPSFARHLNDFIAPGRGPVLQRIGTPRKYKYRFCEPLMQPYVIMQGIACGLLTNATLTWASKK